MCEVRLVCEWCEGNIVIADIENGRNAIQCPLCQKHMFVVLEVRKANENMNYRDPLWLGNQYINAGRTMADIASEFGVTPMTIHQWLRRHEIPTRPRGHGRVPPRV